MQPRTCRARRPSGSQCWGDTLTVTTAPSTTASTPNASRTRAAASDGVTRPSAFLAGRARAAAGLLELGHALLEREQAVHERIRRGRASGHVHVHRDHPVHPLHHVVA